MLQIVVDNTVEETYLTFDEITMLDYGTLVEIRNSVNKNVRIDVYGIVIMNEDSKKGLIVIKNNQIPTIFRYNTKDDFLFVCVPENMVLKLSNK